MDNTSGESEAPRSVESEVRPTRTDVLIVALLNSFPFTGKYVHV